MCSIRELAAAGIDDGIYYAHPHRATVDQLALFHTADYIDKVSRLSETGKGYLDDGDTPAVKGIFNAASDVVGIESCRPSDKIMHGDIESAPSFRSPACTMPHATRAAGFCVFNDCGIAAEYLRGKIRTQANRLRRHRCASW